MEDPHLLLLDPIGHASVAWCSSAATFLQLPTFTVSSGYLPAVAELAAAFSADGVSREPDDVSRLLRAHLELREQVGYWKSRHQQAIARLADRDAEVAELQAKL